MACRLPQRKLQFKSEIGQELRRWREAGGATLEEVAEAVGWQRSAIHKIENGTTSVSLYDYVCIVRFLRDTAPNHPRVKLDKLLGLA